MSYFSTINERQRENEEIAQKIVERAKRKGADEVRASVSQNKAINASSRHCEIENLEFNQSRNVVVSVYRDHRTGIVATTDISDEAIDSAIDAALSLSDFTSPDECAGLADKEDLYTGSIDLETFYELEEDPDEIVKRAINIEKLGVSKIDSTKGLKESDGSSFNVYYSVSTIATSNGFLGSSTRSRTYKDMSFMAEIGEEMQRSSSYSIALRMDMLWSDEKLVDDAVERTVSKLGAKKVATGAYPIILKRAAAASLIDHFIGACNGNLIYRNSSFLNDCIGQTVFPSFINIHDDPWIKGGLGSDTFDNNGSKIEPLEIVKGGVLKDYLNGVYSARKLKMKNNGRGGADTCNVFVTADDEHTCSFEELLKKVGRGLVIDSLMGQGVDLVTGNYSRGASGFLFENGERVHAVNEITIAGNLRDMFKSIAMVTDEYDERYYTHVGSILLPNIMVSGL